MSVDFSRRAVELPLHTGHAPRWLWERMVKLAGAVLEVLVDEFGPEECLRRIAHPVWFQSLGCVLGFDWHSSGVTTTTTGALKEALRKRPFLGLFCAGGKGAASRRTPEELFRIGEKTGLNAEKFVRISRLTARIDNNALQDGYQIYHHTFWVTTSGHWAVVQQGMNPRTRYARRYHWLSCELEDFSNEPHAGVVAEAPAQRPLNLVHRESRDARDAVMEIVREHPSRIVREVLTLPGRHTLQIARDVQKKNVVRILERTYERPPTTFEDLLLTPGLGAKSLRALTLGAEIIYGAEPAYKDPFLYSFAHGGKDGTPYPVDRKTYDGTIEALERAVKLARLGQSEKLQALRRLARYHGL